MSTRDKARRTVRHSERLAKRSIRYAGARKDVARVLQRSPSTISHEVRNRAHPTLKASFAMMVSLSEDAKVSPWAFAVACKEAVELATVLDSDDDSLIASGIRLLTEENDTDRVEDDATLAGELAHAEALARHAEVCLKLSATLVEAHERGIALHALYRERQS